MSIAPVDTSEYSNVNASFFPVAPMDTPPTGVSRVGSVVKENQSEREAKDNPDLNNYYKNVHPQELNADIGTNLSKAAKELDNVMVSAIANGYSVQAACNMKLAEWSYKANEEIFNKYSNFEFDV